MNFVFASKLLNTNRKDFSNFIVNAYNFTDHICNLYPKHFEWFFSTNIPGIFKGTREIIACIDNSEIVGVIFLKNDKEEQKICTLFVVKEYRGKKIATLLIEESFNFLETKKPLITFADYKLEMFKGIIDKYDWVQTQILPVGYYNNQYCELVFNGKIC